MIYIFTYLLIYGPPVLAGYLYYRKQKKKQDENQQFNWVYRFLVPFIIFTITSLVWSGLLYGVSYFFAQG